MSLEMSLEIVTMGEGGSTVYNDYKEIWRASW